MPLKIGKSKNKQIMLYWNFIIQPDQSINLKIFSIYNICVLNMKYMSDIFFRLKGKISQHIFYFLK